MHVDSKGCVAPSDNGANFRVAIVDWAPPPTPPPQPPPPHPRVRAGSLPSRRAQEDDGIYVSFLFSLFGIVTDRSVHSLIGRSLVGLLGYLIGRVGPFVGRYRGVMIYM